MIAASREQIVREPRSAGFFLSRRTVILFSIIAFVLTALLLWWLLRAPRSERGMSALVSAFAGRRLIEPRLAGGFAAAKFDPSRDNREGIDQGALARARQLIEDSVVYEDGFQSAIVQARLLIIDGYPVEAEKLLRKVFPKNETSAAFHNDLGVCLLEAGKLEDALEEFERALERDSGISEARFNRALCYEGLALRDAAREEYSRIVEMERDPGWQSDIRYRIEKLSRLPDPRKPEGEVIASFNAAISEDRTDEAKGIAEENFDIFMKHALIDLTIEHLSEAAGGEKDRSEVALGKMERIGEFFIETKGDRFIADAALYLRNLPERERAEELKLIREYSEAVKATNSKNAAEKEAAFDRLRKLAESFRARGNYQRALRAEIRIAKHLYESNRLESSIAIFEKNRPLVEQHEWRFDRADMLGSLGITYSRIGKDLRSIKICEEARDIYGRMNEKAYEAKIAQYISVAYHRLGDLDSALQTYRQSLHSAFLTSPRLKDLSFTCSAISDIYQRLGNHNLSLLFARQALTFAEATIDPNLIARMLMMVALECAELKRIDEAMLNLGRSLKLLPEIESSQRAYTESTVLTQAGQITFQTGRAAQAIEYYNRAEALSSKTEDNKLLILNAIRERMAALAAEGKIDLARADANRLVEEIENYRGSIAESKYRSSFLEARYKVFDEIISLYATAFNLTQEALQMSERARARAMLDEIESRQQTKPGNASILKTASPLDLKRIMASLPDSLTVVEYAVTEKQTFIFIVRRSGLEVVTSSAGTALIDKLVSQYISDLRSIAPADQMTQKARELYRYLIEPIEGRINRADVVCIVPDKALHFIPFAALIDGDGRYFIDSFRLSYAPSASALAYCLTEYGKKPASKSERIVAVGNPEFDSKRFSNLPPLPDSEREAEESARFYTDATVLRRSDATESRLRAALRDCDVAHFALHCRVEENSPWLAELILANPKLGAESVGLTAAQNDGVLSFDEIYKIDLPRTRLVVLSACESGLGHYYRGEGMVSLARPFISAGVPQVIASLWPVASRETSQLMIEFHRERKNGKGKTVDALREAQLRMARSGLHPFYWAAFIFTGSAD